MKIINNAIFSMALFFSQVLFSEIIQINSLKTAEQTLFQLDKESLVLFDVDCTLVIPNNAILRPVGSKLFKKLDSDIMKNPSIVPEGKYSEDHLLSQVYLQAKNSLVNPESPALIKQLQKRGIRTIALTAAPTGEYGAINSFDDLRVRELNELGFDFADSFSKIPFLKFPKKSDKRFYPIFKSGVLFSGQHSKGHVLKQFLDAIQWHPKKVVFIDDSIGYLESVEQMLNEMGIDFIGFHYMEGKELPCSLDDKVAEFQFRYFAENVKWLSDDQAKELIKK